MAHSTESTGLNLNLPELRPINTSTGGGWPLRVDTTENWAWCKDIFNPSELDAIVRIGHSSEIERATTFGGSDPKVRDSYVNFLYPGEVTSWVFERVAGAINGINAKYFGFDLYGMEQGLQFTRYEAPGEHYDWHIDKGLGREPRKLSLSIQLSNPDDYEGGDLELWFGGEPVKAARERGMITFFPSYVMHRVTPVTKGTRYSLVCWVGGPSFK